MRKKQISSELGNIAARIKAYLEEQKYLDPDDIYPAKHAAQDSHVAVPAVKRPLPPVKHAGSGTKEERCEALKKKVSGCRKCKLGSSRLNAVFGEGNINAKVMFVGEGPGFDEDHQGRPFIGKAGQLLTKIIEAMKFSREEVYIANIVKCHPMINPKNPELRGNDRPPEKEETETCMPYLLEQIELIDPEIICTLGNPSSQALLGTPETISKIRGRIFEFRGRKLIPTYHPAALLRNPGLKAPVWSDMKLLMANLSKPK